MGPISEEDMVCRIRDVVAELRMLRTLIVLKLETNFVKNHKEQTGNTLAPRAQLAQRVKFGPRHQEYTVTLYEDNTVYVVDQSGMPFTLKKENEGEEFSGINSYNDYWLPGFKR